MENTIGQRINQVMESQKMNMNSFSKVLGKSYTALHGTIKGGSKPGYDILESIIMAFPDVNPAWLLTGEGEMIKSAPTPSTLGSTPDSYLVEHLKTLEENFNRLASQLEKKDQQLEAAVETAKGLQRTIDGLMGMPGKSIDVPFESRVLPLWPESKKMAI